MYLIIPMPICDQLDRRLLYELYRDGSVSIPELSKTMGISSSVLYSRIKRLRKRNIIRRYTIQVDDAQLGMGIRAQVGINRNPKLKGQVHQDILKRPEVISLTEVTGRFDIIVTLCVADLETLHETVIGGLGMIAGVQNTETFVELDHIEKEPEYLKPG